jgi:hypothetical protein
MLEEAIRLSVRCARRVALVALFVAAVSAGALSAQVGELQSVSVSPSQPTVEDSIVLHAETTCSNPFSGGPVIDGFLITLTTPPGALTPPCSIGAAPLDITFPLGKLIAGSYKIEVLGSAGLEPALPVYSTVFQVLPAPVSELQSVWVSPTQPTVDDLIVLHAETSCSNPFSGGPVIDGFLITLTTPPGALTPPCPPAGAPLDINFPLGKLIAGSYKIEVLGSAGLEPALPVYSTVFQVLPSSTAVDLLGARFRVRILRPATCSGPACTPALIQQPGVRLADNSAAYTFVDSDNVEVIARILDGGPVNGAFWVFVASLTDQGFTVTVTDLHTPALCAEPTSSAGGDDLPVCVTKTYSFLPGVNQNVIDLQAFPENERHGSK